MNSHYSPIGIFDSGYGGLTIFKEIEKLLPQFDYIYLGDNARVPYGNRSFETVHEFTWQCVQTLFSLGSSFVILACNTASAKALRSIQQKDLPQYAPDKKVLGVIRPTTEIIIDHTDTGHVGILATKGTVSSESYIIEIKKFFPQLHVYQTACPMWVPLIENNEYNDDGADFFVKKYIDDLLSQSSEIDTIVLACTHYPLLIQKIQKYLPKGVNLISQGEIVANSLTDYLERHVDIRDKLSKGMTRKFYTTDDTYDFNIKAKI
ncbi:MAG: glutamate racemase, partial [Bacteroidota bacterium]